MSVSREQAPCVAEQQLLHAQALTSNCHACTNMVQVIGVGGGGGNAITRIIESEVQVSSGNLGAHVLLPLGCLCWSP